MKRSLFLILGLGFLVSFFYLPASLPAHAADLISCQARFLDKSNNVVQTFRPDTAFKVQIHNIPNTNDYQSTYFTLAGKDSSGNSFQDLMTPQRPEKLQNGFQVVTIPSSGYINDNIDGVTRTGLAPGTYTVTLYQLTNGNQISSAQKCGTQQFTVQAYAAPGTCQFNSNGDALVSNKCASGYECQKQRSSALSSLSFNSVCVATGTTGGWCLQNSDCSSGQTCDTSNRTCVSGSSSGGGTGSSAKCKSGQVGIDTDLGCIPTDPKGLASAIFNIILGIAGAVAIILIIAGGFKVAASQGNVEALEDGRDMITKAITGLAFILLASVILSIIGLDILGLNFAFGSGSKIFPLR